MRKKSFTAIASIGIAILITSVLFISWPDLVKSTKAQSSERQKILASKIRFKQLNTGTINIGGGSSKSSSSAVTWTLNENVVILGCKLWIGVQDGSTFEAEVTLRLYSTGRIHAFFSIHKHSDAPYMDHETIWFPHDTRPELLNGQKAYLGYSAVNTGAYTKSIHFVIDIYYVRSVDY